MTDSFFFPEDSSAVWLRRVDARLATHLLKRSAVGANPRVLEIGVWKGAWSAIVLKNVAESTVVGIDPYPDGAKPVRNEMLQQMAALGLLQRFTLHDQVSDLDPSSRFDLIHIDGDHSEEAAWEDLKHADELLAEGGVIVVDDISHKWLPGVASATYRYCGQSDLRMFLLTKAKGYLARKETAAELHRWLYSARHAIPEVRIYRDFQEMADHPYPERSEVLGQPVLLARGDTKGSPLGNSRAQWIARLTARASRLRRAAQRIWQRA